MVDRSVSIRLTADASPFIRGVASASAAASAFARNLESTDSRMTNLVQTSLALGPALVPIGGAAVGGLALLSSGLTAAAGAGVASVLAFQGVGDALTSLSKYQLDPTAANLDNVRDMFSKLGPAATEFTLFLSELRPELEKLQRVAGEEMFPGITEGLESITTQLPVFNRIIGAFASGVGQLSSEAGTALAGPFWDDFFAFIEGDAKDDLVTFGRTLGNFIEGAAAMFQAFDPLADSFSEGLLGVSRSFNDWAQGLSESQGFQEFTDYIRETGPQVADALGSLVEAFADIVVAAAPLGGSTLAIISALADVLGAVASSPAGPALIALASGLSAVSRAMALYNAANGSALVNTLSAVGGVSKSAAGLRVLASGIGAVALSMTDLDDKAGVANTAMFATLGASLGPLGAAAGAALGAWQDQKAAIDDVDGAIANIGETMQSTPGDFAAITTSVTDAQAALDAYDPGMFAKFSIMGDDTKFLQEDLDAATAAQEAYFQSVSDLGNLMAGNTIFTDFSGDMGELTGIAESAAPVLAQLGMTMDDVTGEDFLSQINASLFAASFRAITAEAESVAGKTRDVGDAFAGLDDPLLTSAVAAGELQAALEGLFGILDKEAAVDALIASTKELGQALSEGSRTFNGNSEAALANRDVTREWARTLGDALVARAEAGDDAGKLAQSLFRSREAFISEGVAAGFSRRQMEARAEAIGLTPKLVVTAIRETGGKVALAVAQLLIARYNAIPKDVRTDLEANGVRADATVRSLMARYEGLSRADATTILEAQDNASVVIEGVRARLSALDGLRATSTITTNVVTQYQVIGTPGGRSIVNADGGTLDFYAGGGMRERHVAQIAPAGAMRMWAEPETDGEAYIPFAVSKRPRSLDIWAETGRRLGVQGFAEGGISEKAQGAAIAKVVERFGKDSPIVQVIEDWLAGLKKGELSQRSLADRIEQAVDKQQGINQTEVGKAFRGFRVGDKSTADDVKSEMSELVSALQETLGRNSPVVTRVTALGDQLLAEAKARDKLVESIGELKDSQRELVQAQKSYSSSVSSAYLNDPLQGSLADFDLQTEADTNDARKVLRAMRKLKRLGLDGPLFRELAASGNVALIQEFAELGRRQIHRREELFSSQRGSTRRIGEFAGQQVFGDRIRENNKELRDLNHEMHQLNKRFDKLEGAVERGARRGSHDGSKKGTHEARRDDSRAMTLSRRT